MNEGCNNTVKPYSFTFPCKVSGKQLKKLLTFKKRKTKVYDVYAVDYNNNIKKIGTTTLEPIIEAQNKLPCSIEIKMSYDIKGKEHSAL